MSSASSGTIYPRYCFHLAPTHNTWCLLRAADVHGLDEHAGFEGEKFYFYANLPIKWVRIVGVVVAVDEIAGKRFYTVDDSSGACIEAVVSISPAANAAGTDAQCQNIAPPAPATNVSLAPASLPYANVDVGSVVDIKGKLGSFRDEMQVLVEKMNCLKSTSQEVALWDKRAVFYRDVLSQPWVLRRRDIRKCQKEAERSNEENERKRKRLKAVTEGDMSRKPSKPAPTTKVSNKASRGKATVDLKELIERGSGVGAYNALGL